MKVEIDSDLFDRIERYLESQLPDGEEAAILRELEVAEIERTAQQEGLSIPPSKNHIFMGINGNQIDVRITATSEEVAQTMYVNIERSLIEGVRFDLETEWSRDDSNEEGKSNP